MGIVVTGAAGFVGWRVCERLLDEGLQVLGLDNLSGPTDGRLKSWRLSTLKSRRGFEWLNVDISVASALSPVFNQEVEGVIHLAARPGVRDSVKNPRSYILDNVLATATVLECAGRYGIPKLVLASSSSVYGNSPRPFCEDMITDCPISPYAASKKSAELLAYSYFELFGIDISVLRFFTVYGPAGRPDMSPFRFVRWIVEQEPVRISGDGKQIRDFTFVEDVAAATISALGSRKGFEIFNIGAGNPHSILEFVEEIEDATRSKAKVEFTPKVGGDVEGTWADISKAKRLLSWVPSTELAEGVSETVDWYMKNRDWAGQLSLGN